MSVKINLTPQVPSVPYSEDKTKIDVRYMVISPFVSIHIYWNPKISELVYEVEEPTLSEEDRKNLSRVEQAMREMVNVNLVGGKKTPEELIDYVDKTARLIVSELGLKIEEEVFDKMIYYLFRDFIGLNEIEPLMRDYFIEDIELR